MAPDCIAIGSNQLPGIFQDCSRRRSGIAIGKERRRSLGERAQSPLAEVAVKFLDGRTGRSHSLSQTRTAGAAADGQCIEVSPDLLRTYCVTKVPKLPRTKEKAKHPALGFGSGMNAFAMSLE